MDPEKVKAWFETPEGKKLFSEMVDPEVEAQVALKIESGELLTPAVAKANTDAAVKKAVGEVQAKADEDAKLEENVNKIHAAFPTTPKADIKAELEKHTNPEVRQANADRMLAVAEKNAAKNVPAASDPEINDDPKLPVEARFDALVKKGLIKEPKDPADRRRKLAVFKKNAEAYGVA